MTILFGNFKKRKVKNGEIMSYYTWTVNGYGICTNDIKTTKERVEKLLQLAPKFNDIIHTWFKESGIENPELDDYLECDEDLNSGVAYLLQRVIDEVENVRLGIAEDFDSYYYLMICPSYTWTTLTNEEKELNTKEKVNDLFRKYVEILTDNDVTIEYQSVENGG